MLSLGDCIAMSGLTEEEVAIVAEHERLSMVVAAELGYTLLKTAKGVFTLRCYIVEVLEHAKLAGDRDKAKHVDRVLVRFNAAHPSRRVL
jgi:hypothetical protein